MDWLDQRKIAYQVLDVIAIHGLTTKCTVSRDRRSPR
jgi:hypothetical protein